MGQLLHELVQKVEAKEIVRTVEVEDEPRIKSVVVKRRIEEEDRSKSLGGTQFIHGWKVILDVHMEQRGSDGWTG